MAGAKQPMNPPQSFSDSMGPLPTTDQAVIGEQARAWAIKLKTGQPTTEDVAAFRRWRAQSAVHAQAWAQASQDWKTLGAMAQVYQDRHPQRVAKPPRQQIGRASCRERVCQYVKISVAAGSLKQK